jgi:hypothetical protein
MKRRRLRIRADAENIAFSAVSDNQSDELIDGVRNITWTYEQDTGAAIVILTIEASCVDFDVPIPVIRLPPKET